MNTQIGARHRAPHVALVAVLGLLLALAPGFAGAAARADSTLVDLARVQHAGTSAYILEHVEPTGLGREWEVLGLARSDVDAEEWLDAYYANLVEDVVEKDGKLGPATTYERVVIALSAMGKDVTDVGGHDLLTGLADMSTMGALNSAVFGLLALDTLGHEIPEVAGATNPTTRQKLVDRVLALEINGGGWTFSGSTPDPDMTGMALQALARYADQPAVAAAVERGVSRLSDIQRPSGGFASYGKESAESTTQVIVALTALRIDPLTDPRFGKDGGNPVSALTTYYVEGGGFWYSKPGTVSGMSTAQGFYGLTDYLRFVDGKPGLYVMDVADPEVTVTTLAASSPRPGVVALAAEVAGAGATGTVEFSEVGSKVGDAVLVGGRATLRLTGVAAGEHTYTATFVPLSSAFKGSSGTASVVVAQGVAQPVPSETAGPQTQVKPRAVVLKARVRADVAVSKGQVRFVVRRGGEKLVTRSAPVDARGVATVTIKKPVLRRALQGARLRGKYRVVVRYLGSTEVKRSSSSGTFRI
ncbi:Ig-like domain repeat protein [Nocardioides sp. zg-DK7169]|uniref:Ig-like domain repeat protein n=1 Tax=Nocardioides sp. zg-DK7169 TaxID=2736600 RepID=UPI001555BF8B|nr:Ig-like domain repeat protein [Nocardioides sp. zg-DK7169]NPC95219.1 hypothetical protein [Nocardioides sp. zg-DK7169]